MVRKLQAFTLIELLVAMVLSGIVIGMAYFVFNLSETDFAKKQKDLQKTNNILQLQGLIIRDCDNAIQARFESDQLAILKYDLSSISYYLIENEIIREDEYSSDTFKLGPYTFEENYLFMKPPVLEKLQLQILQDSFYISAQVDYSNKYKFDYSRELN
jgi:prepilin-type N-terminal cleavage/methylation domain-containing protein